MADIVPKSLETMTREISLLIEYGAPDDEFALLNETLEKYDSDLISLNVFHHFYSYLPDAKDDGIVKISKIANRQGIFLFCITTLLSDYLYLATRETAALVGPIENSLDDPELLEFFGWKDSKQFDRATEDLAEYPEHTPINESHDLCPVCGTGDGELHAFGCPVEICPWCDSQLTRCECRFTKTGRDNFDRDSHLQELLDLLEAEGRIPFDAGEHRPSFMSEE